MVWGKVTFVTAGAVAGGLSWNRQPEVTIVAADGKSGPVAREVVYPERAPEAGVPLPYFVAALVALLAFELVMAIKAPSLAGWWRRNPALLVAVHLFVLGWGTTLMFGAIYQMAPVVLEGQLWRPGWSRWHLGLHAIGVTLLVAGFWIWTPLWVITGGTLVLLGALLYSGNIAMTLLKAPRRSPVGLGIGLSTLYLILVLSWGVTLALNLRWPLIPEAATNALLEHLILGLVGWFTLMIVAAAYKLIPMFAVAPPAPPRRVTGIIAGLGATPLLATLTLALLPAPWGSLLARVALAGGAVAVLFFLADILTMYRRRPRRPMEPPVRFAAAAVLLLAGLLAVGAGIMAGIIPTAPRAMVAYLAMVMLGWIGTMSMGQLYRILPFIVWLHRFRHRRSPTEGVPFIHEMAPRNRATAILLLWLPAVAMQVAGLGLGQVTLLRLGSLLALVAVALFAGVMAGVLRYLDPQWWPEKPRPQA